MNGLRLYWLILCLSISVQLLHAQISINSTALTNLETACRKSHSTSYSVIVDGRLIIGYPRDSKDRLVPCHSVLKSIAALAVGKLIKDGKIRSPDEPVSELFPEWKQGLKNRITIRQLLNHTSGLLCDDINDDYFSASDVVQHALSSPVTDTPGTRFYYNSKAFLLLLGVIGKASGMSTDRYIEKSVFRPLGIEKFSWDKDTKGNVTGLSTTASELIKVGELVLNGGRHNNKELIPETWVKQMLKVSQPYTGNYGLLWWLIPDTTHYIVDDDLIKEFQKAGVKQEITDKFRRLKGNYINVNIPADKLRSVFGENWQDLLDKEFYPYYPTRSRRKFSKTIIGYKAEGYLGQYIIIYPDKKIVATRMIFPGDNYHPATDEMLDFEQYVYRLVAGN